MSNSKDTKQKTERLRNQIDDLRYRYHVINDPEVTDQMYEGLMDELRKIEEKYPELITKDSPTQRVAGIPADKFEKIKHTVTQWSFNDAFNEEDLKNWEERNLKILEKELGSRPNDLDYVCELKIDGLHMVLSYENGKLVTAATRGDGKIGENVTQNIKTIMSVPLTINSPLERGESVLKKNNTSLTLLPPIQRADKERIPLLRGTRGVLGVGEEKLNMVAEGEVWMGRHQFEKLNKEREKIGEPLFANPRNASAGTIRQLDAKIVQSRRLEMTLYDISSFVIPSERSDEESLKAKINSQQSELVFLKELGFKTDNHWKVCKNIGEILEFYKTWQKKKDSQEFWIDGVVVKVNQKKYQDALGYTGKAPRWAIALKFPAEQGTTRIKDIYVQVGRTGALTPVALMEPVQLAGTTVTHATLHNFDEIERLGVKIGDMVVVEKAGDIIPKVVRVLDKMRTGAEKAVKNPVKCPICGEKVDRRIISPPLFKDPTLILPLKREEDDELRDHRSHPPLFKEGLGEVKLKNAEKSVAYFCTNKKCYAQELKKIIHFVSKKAFDIDGMGKKIVEQLLNEGIIKNPADIFTLTKGDLEPLERFAEKSAENLIEAINNSKEITLARFLFALGIHHVGEESAIDLAKHYGTLEKLSKATEEELQELSDIGPQVAKSIFEYFGDENNQKYLEELIKNGVYIHDTQTMEHGTRLQGKSFVLTGTLEKLTRDEAKDKIRELGGEISSSVSKKTDYVVVGENPGSKLKKANELGVEILDEPALLKMIS